MTLIIRAWRLVYVTMVYAKRHAPKWLIPVMGVCAFIPGPFDELLVLAVIAYPVLRSKRKREIFRRYLVRAWNGPMYPRAHSEYTPEQLAMAPATFWDTAAEAEAQYQAAVARGWHEF